ncbi:hypothetical protein GCM10011374_30460 [Kocuria dechangensis]|uniref:Uncharacterized protein n=1 Tax=Kocuria dechangensis TaxID=1176249 RepID=A0A917H1S7_9MICC|nr:hypothetical protein [Kocuria dechangensis]GGG64682.1 hypothetical protein GCM10011374_30460 [Kocuria dechangensis]
MGTMNTHRTATHRPMLLGVLALQVLLTGCSTDRFVDLNTLYAEGEPWELATNARDTTDALCAAAMPACVQALSTDQAHYLKYDSVQEAEDAMSVAGDAEVARAGAIVVEFTDPTLTQDEKEQLVESVACVHESDC